MHTISLWRDISDCAGVCIRMHRPIFRCFRACIIIFNEDPARTPREMCGCVRHADLASHLGCGCVHAVALLLLDVTKARERDGLDLFRAKTVSAREPAMRKRTWVAIGSDIEATGVKLAPTCETRR